MFLTQIINGQATELALCEECAKAKGLFDPQSLTFAEKFFPEEFRKRVDKLIKELSASGSARKTESVIAPPGEDTLTRCPVCNFTLEDFRRTGRLGCPSCYRTFDREIHAGKVSAGTGPETSKAEESKDPGLQRSVLEKKLNEAIQREDYEEAARLRDLIHDLA